MSVRKKTIKIETQGVAPDDSGIRIAKKQNSQKSVP
jgi:hypothetical protein